MPGVKTAISMDEELFNQVNRLAHDLRISRSRLFTLAVRDFLQHQENQALLARLNNAYSGQANEEEQKISRSMQDRHKKMVRQEPW